MTTPQAPTALTAPAATDGAALPRLDGTTVLPQGVQAPPARPAGVGIVHLGLGAFHRAHQAVLTEDAAAATGDDRWGILGVTQRSARVVEQLRPQDGLFGVLTVGAHEQSLRVVGSVLDVAFPGTETGRVLAAVAAPTTHLVTLTVTEKGYVRRPDGALDLDAVAGDLDAAAAELVGGALASGASVGGASVGGALGAPAEAVPATTAVGLLVRGLVARFRAGGAPLTVLSCDNVAANGTILAGLVAQAVDAVAERASAADTAVTDAAVTDGSATDAVAGLRAWLAASVTFPCSMVDRIVPATTEAQRETAAALLGARDEALVVGEPFAQWVIEDRFAGPRPAWERAGALLVADVEPYEHAKLRLLNGTHSLLAYAGVLAGHRTMAEAVTDPVLARLARCLQAEARVGLEAPEGLDLVDYSEQLLERFANPATGHLTQQVAMDGTQKIPVRWGPVLAAYLERTGEVPVGVASGLAAWVAFVERAVRGGDGAPVLDDARADEVRRVVTGAPADGVAAALLALPGLLPDGLGTDPRVVGAVVHALRDLYPAR